MLFSSLADTLVWLLLFFMVVLWYHVNHDMWTVVAEKHLSSFFGSTKDLTPEERGKHLETDAVWNFTLLFNFVSTFGLSGRRYSEVHETLSVQSNDLSTQSPNTGRMSAIAAFMHFNYCFATAETFILSLLSLGILTLVWEFRWASYKHKWYCV